MLIESYENEFKLTKKDAAALSISSVYVLGDGNAIRGNLEKVLKPSLPNFSEAQADSAIQLLKRLIVLDASPNPLRVEFVDEAERLLKEAFRETGKWE